MQQYSLCSTSSIAKCTIEPIENVTSIELLFTNINADQLKDLNLNINTAEPVQAHICNPSAYMHHLMNSSSYNVTCQLEKDPPYDCVYNSGTFWIFVIFLFTGTIGFNVANSISDAICFDMLGESEEDKYGAQRVWGTIGFGSTALLAGIVVNLWTSNEMIKSFTPALIIMFVFSGCDILSAGRLKLPQLSSSESIFKDVWDLVKHPAIGIFLIFATIAGMMDAFINYFMFWHLEKVAEQTGYMSQIKLIEGCVVAAECLGGEVPFFFYSGKIIKKLGYIHCMSMCFFFYAVRLALISWIPNPWYLVVVEFFCQGCTYALCYTCIVAYASAVAPPGTSATVQGLMAGMDDGLGCCIGSLIGGFTFNRFGGQRSFRYFATMALFTCVAHILIRPTSRKKQYLPKNINQNMPVEEVALNNGKSS